MEQKFFIFFLPKKIKDMDNFLFIVILCCDWPVNYINHNTLCLYFDQTWQSSWKTFARHCKQHNNSDCCSLESLSENTVNPYWTGLLISILENLSHFFQCTVTNCSLQGFKKTSMCLSLYYNEEKSKKVPQCWMWHLRQARLLCSPYHQLSLYHFLSAAHFGK